MFGMGMGSMGVVGWRGGQFVLDGIGTAPAAAYSTRRLSSTYNGSALRVRRDSDNTEADIGFNTDGTLNETALLAHVGAGSGFVSKWYDQSGQARDMAQATAASQPRIVNAGVIDRLSTRAAVRTDGVAQTMASGSFAVAQPLTRASALQMLSPGANGIYFAGVNGTAPLNQLWQTAAAGSLAMYGGNSVVLKSGINANDKATVVEIFNGASSNGSYNGAVTSANAGVKGIDGIQLGGVGGSAFASALYGDLIVFPVALDATTRANLEANQKQFWGTP